MIGSNDIEKSKVFYDAILSVLGYPAGVIDAKGRCLYINQDCVLGITKPVNGGVACEDPPGIRTSGQRKMYLAYLRDPAGNKLCATHHMSTGN
ncbi:VOC family protein [Vibrio cholerae]|nr:VOC family protein [Vibrio cholerae]